MRAAWRTEDWTDLHSSELAHRWWSAAAERSCCQLSTMSVKPDHHRQYHLRVLEIDLVVETIDISARAAKWQIALSANINWRHEDVGRGDVLVMGEAQHEVSAKIRLRQRGNARIEREPGIVRRGDVEKQIRHHRSGKVEHARHRNHVRQLYFERTRVARIILHQVRRLKRVSSAFRVARDEKWHPSLNPLAKIASRRLHHRQPALRVFHRVDYIRMRIGGVVAESDIVRHHHDISLRSPQRRQQRSRAVTSRVVRGYEVRRYVVSLHGGAMKEKHDSFD